MRGFALPAALLTQESRGVSHSTPIVAFGRIPNNSLPGAKTNQPNMKDFAGEDRNDIQVGLGERLGGADGSKNKEFHLAHKALGPAC